MPRLVSSPVPVMNESTTLPFETFWNWMTHHPNCILRAGTPEAVLYDDDDFHWHFALENETTLLVQVLRGKRLMGEILVEPSQIDYVQEIAGDRDDEVVFELIAESEKDRVASYFFVLAHSYQQDEGGETPRIH